MSDTDWQAVAEVFEAAIQLPPDARPSFLDENCAADLRPEVDSLLAAHEASTGFLAPLAVPGDPDGTTDGPAIGTRIGAYRLVRVLGRGGMGTVFLGARADDDFEHDVAIKVTRSPISDPLVARRFQLERQALASLHHPHIVTLLDGGTLPTGHAYLVMEHVAGSPVTHWLGERRTSLESRLRMFRQICSAVHAAHQHGIVHRDLKPANILVTADGMPKVLDFGIAKLLAAEVPADGAGAGETLAAWGHGPLTPDYASPEQLRGLPVTTAGDVYSLGVLLYEMLAGRRPYETSGRTIDEVIDQVRRGPYRRVSAAASGALPYPGSRLRGDLDAIVQKAMHVDAGDRYASAEELSDDVARFLGGKVVTAREPTLGYVLRKLAAQHRLAVAAVALALVAITAGLGVALWQRQQAIAERARAEARFNDVRALANALIFKVHDAVARLDGSTDVRRMIVAEALGYLDTLASSGGDASLQLELAKGYKQIARAQGDVQTANLGDYAGAHANLTRAIRILDALQGSVLWRDAGLELVHALRTLAVVEQSLGRRPESLRTAARALTTAEALVGRAPTDDELRRMLASAHFNRAIALARAPGAMDHWERAGSLFEALWRARPDDPDRMRNVALVDKYYGALLLEAQQTAEAIRRYARALDLDERRLAAAPSVRQIQFDVAIDLANMAAALAWTDRRAEALTYYDRSIAMREPLLAADGKNRTARLVLIRALANAARVAHVEGLRARTRAYVARARAVAAEDPTISTDRNHQRDLVTLGIVEAHLAAADDKPAACALYARAMALAAKAYAEPERTSTDSRWFAASARALACGT